MTFSEKTLFTTKIKIQEAIISLAGKLHREDSFQHRKKFQMRLDKITQEIMNLKQHNSSQL